jgi:hypothetical protein
VFIPYHLTLGRVVEHRRDHIHLLDNLPKSMTLAQKIVASLVFPVTEILAIKDHKLDITFLHVAFRSQSMLKPTSDQTGSDIKIPRQNLAYVPKQTQRASPLALQRPDCYRKANGIQNQARVQETFMGHRS